MSKFISLEDAIDIVMELADRGLEEIESNGREPMAERDRKQAAIDTIHDYFVNTVFN